MSAQNIYKILTGAGMTPTGAVAMLGNMQAESALRSDNAQDGMTPLSDVDYTMKVDNGLYTNFNRDAVGYGLCQWTYWTRKQALFVYAKSKGVSIGDETMQVNFCIKELTADYSSLWKYLCTTDNLYEATSRICEEYERPAVNNIAVRVKFAEEFYSQFAKNSEESTNSTDKSSDAQMCTVRLPVLKLGSKGLPVWLLQTLLNRHEFYVKWTDGDFGANTLENVTAFQTAKGLSADGIVGHETWTKLLTRQ